MAFEPAVAVFDACILYPFHLRIIVVQAAIDRLVEGRTPQLSASSPVYPRCFNTYRGGNDRSGRGAPTSPSCRDCAAPARWPTTIISASAATRSKTKSDPRAISGSGGFRKPESQ